MQMMLGIMENSKNQNVERRKYFFERKKEARNFFGTQMNSKDMTPKRRGKLESMTATLGAS